MNLLGPTGTSVCGWKCSKLTTVYTLRAFHVCRQHRASAFTQELCVISFHACERVDVMGWCKLVTLAVGQPSWISPTRWFYFLGDRSEGATTGRDASCPRAFPRVEWSFMPPLSLPHRRISGNAHARRGRRPPLASEELHVNACDSQTPGVPRLWEGQAAGKGLEMKT